MPEVTTAQAAELTGKNRTTIWRACKTGRISAVRGAAGDFLIQVAELERAYGTLRAPQPANGLQEVAEQQPATSFATSILEHEVALLRERVASLERDKDDLRGERDRLLGVLEKQSDHIKLLTDQRAPETPPSFWQRLLRRA